MCLKRVLIPENSAGYGYKLVKVDPDNDGRFLPNWPAFQVGRGYGNCGGYRGNQPCPDNLHDSWEIRKEGGKV